jgi:serine/threonine protein kinase/Tol biopolymer transport system component
LLSSGTKLGPYEIVAPLGAGGMGEVYRARDTRLDRVVAIKILPQHLAATSEVRQRFEREARAVSSLNHPHICTLYDVGHQDGTDFLVMEYLEGETLAKRLEKGSLPISELLRVAIEIAGALDKAHRQGVTHRDLKPGNIILTKSGAKLLDFGLAKAAVAPTAVVDLSSSPTMTQHIGDAPTSPLTARGTIVGTFQYMAPEQLEGQEADARSDIFAFGATLYEMATARKAFEGKSQASLIAAILERDPPPISALQPMSPPVLDRVAKTCLAKDPDDRFQSAHDLKLQLEWIRDAGSQAGVPAPVVANRKHRERIAWAAAAAFAIVSILFAIGYVARAPQRTSLHFTAVTNFAGVQAQPALSPDGRSVAFISNRDGHYNIYVGLITGGSLVQVTNDANLKDRPAWSPDGTTIAFARLNHSGIWDIWEVPALGGTPRRLILNARDPAWSPDGHSLAYENAADDTLWVSGLSGENAHQVVPTLGGEWRDTEPRFSPDGRQIAFSSRSNGPYGELELADLGSGKVRALTRDNALALSPAWSPDGRFIYFASSRGGTMNVWKIAATGSDPEQITAGQGDDAQLDVSSDGKKIVFSTWRVNTNIAQLDLAAKAGQQSVRLLTTDPGRNQEAPAYSPDGKHLASFSNLKGAEKESIWVSNADGSNPVEVARDNRVNIFPRWSPDSQHVIYQSETGAARTDEFRSVPVSGGAPETFLKNATDRLFDVGLDGRLLFRSPEGQVVAFDSRTNKTEVLGPVHGNLPWAPVRFSPDGRAIAYINLATREDDPGAGVWVDDFKSPPRQVFRGWTSWWLVRGPQNEIYFVEGKPDLNGVLWKVGWDGKGLERTSATIPMIYSYWVDPVKNSQDHFDVSPDGRHVAFDMQTVLGANIGVIENVR